MQLSIEQWDDPGLVPDITRLLHAAYRELAEMGFRYLATHQDEKTTSERLSEGEAYLARSDGELVGTIGLIPPRGFGETPWYAQPHVAVFGQFAVHPSHRHRGIGRTLLDTVERRARELGAGEIACDTAEGADHLIELYARRGYRFVEFADWEVTNYRSVILSKRLEGA